MNADSQWRSIAAAGWEPGQTAAHLALAAILAAAVGIPPAPAAGGQSSETASAVAPVVAPDSRTVAFALVTPSRTELAVVPAIGGAFRIVAGFAGKAAPVQWFPDGKALLVVEQGSSPAIWRVPWAGGDKRRLGQGECPRLSPGGRWLGYVSGGQLQLMDLSTGKTGPAGPLASTGWKMGDWLDDDRLFVLSGDGSLLQLRASAPRESQVLVPHRTMQHCFVAAAANARRRLIAVTSDDMQLADRSNPTSIWIFDAAGKETGRPIPNASRPQWSDAGTLYFTRRAAILGSLDFSATRTLSQGETWSVSPDESCLFVSRRDVDTNGDGLVNWLDAAQLYRIPIRAGRAAVPRKLAP